MSDTCQLCRQTGFASLITAVLRGGRKPTVESEKTRRGIDLQVASLQHNVDFKCAHAVAESSFLHLAKILLLVLHNSQPPMRGQDREKGE